MERYMLWAVATSAGAPILYGRFRPSAVFRKVYFVGRDAQGVTLASLWPPVWMIPREP